MTYSAISPLAVGTFHAAPRHARKAAAPARRTARVGGGGGTILSAAAARRDRLRALPVAGKVTIARASHWPCSDLVICPPCWLSGLNVRIPSLKPGTHYPYLRAVFTDLNVITRL